MHASSGGAAVDNAGLDGSHPVTLQAKMLHQRLNVKADLSASLVGSFSTFATAADRFIGSPTRNFGEVAAVGLLLTDGALGHFRDHLGSSCLLKDP
jgi:hypothetical protein